MNAIVRTSSAAIALPPPRCAIAVRMGTLADVAFIDEMQKKFQKSLGFSPRKQIEGKIAAGQVLVAEAAARASRPCSSGESQYMGETPMPRLGFCVWQDRYSGRDDLGVFYNVVVRPDTQRKLVGAALVKAAFERAAYGCKLFCCWCAQDIDANYFWESLGFVPLAFRTGSRAKERTHIFWERRIRENDVSTPYWFPFNTRGGMMNEARLVIPIPPGTHWKDAKPIVLTGVSMQLEETAKPKALPGARPAHVKQEQAMSGKVGILVGGKIRYINKPGYVAPLEAQEAPKPKRVPRPRAKIDPKYLSAARELRDRYLEQVESGAWLPESCGKYEVARQIEDHGQDAHATVEAIKTVPLLAA